MITQDEALLSQLNTGACPFISKYGTIPFFQGMVGSYSQAVPLCPTPVQQHPALFHQFYRVVNEDLDPLLALHIKGHILKDIYQMGW